MKASAASREQLRQRLELRRSNAAQPVGRINNKTRRARENRSWRKEW